MRGGTLKLRHECYSRIHPCCFADLDHCYTSVVCIYTRVVLRLWNTSTRVLFVATLVLFCGLGMLSTTTRALFAATLVLFYGFRTLLHKCCVQLHPCCSTALERFGTQVHECCLQLHPCCKKKTLERRCAAFQKLPTAFQSSRFWLACVRTST